MSEDAQAPALDFSPDTDVVPRRRARKVIYSPSDLTVAEKTALIDLVQAGVDVRAGERVAVTRADFDNLMSLVFGNDWNTSIEISNLANFPPRGFEGETIQVGTFSRTQHEPRSAEETPLERREGAPVFLYIKPRFTRQDFWFSFVDAAKKKVSERYVDLRPGATLTDLKAELIQHLDDRESERVRSFNSASLLIIGRRRIARFARVGTFNPPNVLARDLPKRLVRVTRTQEHIAAIGDSYKNEAKFESGEEVETEEEEEEVPVEPLAKLIVSEEL
ncbi:hypothetical protein NW755_001860 [Fusarium falciforme]|uniref:Uncharacterized protein n=1 Tax=Fusarium falciforme TaxID=195108 RepID=A0A9W8V4A0_9HYPO|nr:hypothetical protein NW755_001860 [Fusarium falciforme]